MNEDLIHLTRSLESANIGNRNPQEVIIETFKKFDVDFKEIDKEVNILNFQILQTQERDKNSVFEEFESISYRILLVTYNVEFLIRLLTFHNDTQAQILKLDIQPRTIINTKKEIEYCCNSLQRRRNLCLMFKTIITFSKFIESRRLICDLILKKNRNINIEQNKDGGIIVVYTDVKRNVRIGIFWSIACSSTYDITDVIEVYYKFEELPLLNKYEIRNKLNMLTEPCLDFTKKYRLWKLLIDELSDKTLFVVIDKMPDTSTTQGRFLEETREVTAEVTVLSDEEEPCRSLVNVNEMPNSTTKKVLLPYDNRLDKTQMVLVLSDSDEPSKSHLVVEIDKMPILSSCYENIEVEGLNVTLLSDSEKSSRKSLVVEVDRLPEDSATRGVLSPSHDTKNVAVQKVTVLSDSEESPKLHIDDINKIPKEPTRKVLSPCPDITKEQEFQNISVLSVSEESSGKSLDNTVERIPEKSTRKVFSPGHDKTGEKPAQKDTVISKSKEPSRKSLEVGTILDSFSTKADTSDPQKDIGKEVEDVNILSSDSDDILKKNNDIGKWSKNLQASSEVVNSLSTKKPRGKLIETEEMTRELLTYLQLEKAGSTKNIETSVGMSKILRKKISKIKVAELESSDSSDSELVSKKSPRKKKHKSDSSSDEYYTPSDIDIACSDSGKRASSSSEDEFLPKEILGRMFETKKLLQTPKRSIKKKIAPIPCRKSPRNISIYDVEGNNSPTPISRPSLRTLRRSLRSESRPGQMSVSNVATPTSSRGLVLGTDNSPKQMLTNNFTTPPRNNGLFLVSDSATINSVLPSNILTVITPEKGVTASIPRRNVRIRLIPDAPVNKSPSFVELNLFTPPKKPKFSPKKIDEDLEITSVTYIVPD